MRAPLCAAIALLAVASAGPVLAQDGDVVATVNGEPLTKADMEAAYQALPQQYQQMPMEQLYEPLRERLIDGELLLDKAQSDNLAEEEAVKRRLEQAREAVLQEAVVTRTVEEATSEDKLRAAYDARKADPGFAFEEVKARHILLESKEEAEAVIEELKQGADFAELAQARSTGPSGPQGGDLGWFRKEAMVAPFAEAAFALEKGTYTQEPVETQFGWHVIQVEDKRSSEPAFEEMAPVLRDELAAEAAETMMADLRQNAQIERFDPAGAPAQDPRAAEGEGETPTPQQ